MTNDRPIMEQFHEVHHILNQIRSHGMVMDEAIAVASIIDKLPNSWKDTKHLLKHKKEDMSMEQLGTHLRIEEGIRAQDGVKDTTPSIPKSTVNLVKGRFLYHNLIILRKWSRGIMSQIRLILLLLWILVFTWFRVVVLQFHNWSMQA